MTDHEDLITRLRAAAVLAAKEAIGSHQLPSGMTVSELLDEQTTRDLSMNAAQAVLDAVTPIMEAELRDRDSQANVAMKVAERLAAAGAEAGAVVRDTFQP